MIYTDVLNEGGLGVRSPLDAGGLLSTDTVGRIQVAYAAGFALSAADDGGTILVDCNV